MNKVFLPSILLAVLLVSGCVTTYKAGAPRGEVDVIAHRGASAYTPENTIAAFDLALDMKADWFELDCYLTKDEAVIVIHDDSVDRTTNGTGKVRDMTLEELKALDAGSWSQALYAGEPLPTLEESLDFARDRIGVYIEIKSSDNDGALIQAMLEAAKDHEMMIPALQAEMMALVETSGTRNLTLTRKAIAAVRERDMRHQIVIQSFSPVVCFIALTEAPELRTEFLGSDPEDKPEQWPQFVAFGRLIGVHGFNVAQDSLTRARIDEFKAMGKSVAVWTVDDEAAMRRFARMGVDAIITNRPDVCMQVLGRN